MQAFLVKADKLRLRLARLMIIVGRTRRQYRGRENKIRLRASGRMSSV
jgi:hypothetical protein